MLRVPMRKAPKVTAWPGPGHQFADQFLVGGDEDGAGGEEEGDLGEGVHGDMHRRADQGGLAGQHGPQDDVAELAYGGVGQPRLEVVLGHGDQRGEQDGGRGDPDQATGARRCAEMNAPPKI